MHLLAVRTMSAGRELATGALCFAPDAQEIAAPEFGNLRFGIAVAQEFGSNVLRLAFVVPAGNAATVVEVGRDADMVDADSLDCVIDGVY